MLHTTAHWLAVEWAPVDLQKRPLAKISRQLFKRRRGASLSLSSIVITSATTPATKVHQTKPRPTKRAASNRLVPEWHARRRLPATRAQPRRRLAARWPPRARVRHLRFRQVAKRADLCTHQKKCNRCKEKKIVYSHRCNAAVVEPSCYRRFRGCFCLLVWQFRCVEARLAPQTRRPTDWRVDSHLKRKKMIAMAV